MESTGRKRYAKPFLWLVTAAGAFACLHSIYHLQVAQLDVSFLLVALFTICIGSRIIVKLPSGTSQVTVSDTFVFLTILLFGGEAAVLLAAAEGLATTPRFSKKPSVILFNAGQMALATFLTVFALRVFFGGHTILSQGDYSGKLLAALCVMALVQYIVNSGASAIAVALKNDQPIWHTWQTNYLWTSITHFVGAFAAGIIAKLITIVGFYALLVATPIITIVYFTYQTYLKNVEAAAQNALQAERHVEELSLYIAEQDRIREQFSQIEKLSALGELASGVAHDFNNTLAGILGRAQLMLRTNDPEKIKRGLNIIIQSAEDGAKTVKRIQDFARQRRDHDFEPIAVDQILLDIGEITRPRWKGRAEAANIHINLNLNVETHAMVMGDASELREVLVNMVFNAVDAMPEGGTLTLAAREIADSVEISIGDTGTGMSQEVCSRIFDPFFTTKGKAGLGLGLAVSYGIIRRHEGDVEVESEPERGTTFRIKLPIAKGAKAKDLMKIGADISVPVAAPDFGEALTMNTTAMPLIQSVRTKILVVDDEQRVRELLRDVLENIGCEVVLASGGHEALEDFKRTEFDAVFTDVGMPGMSGWELACAVRERNASIPIAVITGWGEAVGSNEQKAAQVDWVVTKPFSADRIGELVQEVSQRKSDTSGTHRNVARAELTVAA